MSEKKKKKRKNVAFPKVREVTDAQLKKNRKKFKKEKEEGGWIPLVTQYGYDMAEPTDRDYGRHPDSDIDRIQGTGKHKIDWEPRSNALIELLEEEEEKGSASGGYVKKYTYGGRVAKSSAEKS